MHDTCMLQVTQVITQSDSDNVDNITTDDHVHISHIHNTVA